MSRLSAGRPSRFTFSPAVRHALLAACATVVAFLPGLFGDFVNWDDDRNFLQNPAYRGLGWQQLSWMWSTFHMGHYKPLTWLTLGADHVFWGMNPFGYHLTSLLLHAVSTLVFLSVARRLLQAAMPATIGEVALRIGAVGAALLFAVHPLRVESVVWITQRRDVLSGLFYLLTVLAYLQATGPGRERGPAANPRPCWSSGWYWGALALFVCALLSKSIVVSLPVVLLILDVYPLRRLGGSVGWTSPAARRVWVEKLPFAALSGIASVVAFRALSTLDNAPPFEQFGVAARAAVSLHGLAFYLWKTVVPLDLSPVYELSMPVRPLSAPFLVSGAAVVTLGTLVYATRRRWPALTAVSSAYAVTLLPVLGIAQNGPQLAADRYSYLSCLGWALLGGAGLAWCASAWSGPSRKRWLAGGLLGAGTAAVILLTALTAWQTLVWHDSVTLWGHALKLDPGSSVAHTGLGITFLREGKPDEAAGHFEQALNLFPGSPDAHAGLALVLAVDGRAEEAERHGRAAASLRSSDARYQHVLGDLLRVLEKREAALAAYREAARLAPRVPRIRYSMAQTLAEMGRTEEALASLETGRRLAASDDLEAAEGHRFEALIYTESLPDRAIAAWERYVAALSGLPESTPGRTEKILLGLGALEKLREPGKEEATAR